MTEPDTNSIPGLIRALLRDIRELIREEITLGPSGNPRGDRCGTDRTLSDGSQPFSVTIVVSARASHRVASELERRACGPYAVQTAWR